MVRWQSLVYIHVHFVYRTPNNTICVNRPSDWEKLLPVNTYVREEAIGAHSRSLLLLCADKFALATAPPYLRTIKEHSRFQPSHRLPRGM